MKTRTFDVAFLGTSLCGLVAAVALQRKGTKVVIIQSAEEERFDPSMTEFLSGFTVRPFLKRAGFHPTEVNAIPALDVPVQIVHNRYRINFYGEEVRFKQELQREFPLHHEHVIDLFKNKSGKVELFQHLFNSRTHLPPKGFFSRRQFFKSLQTVCDPEDLKFKNTGLELEKYHLEKSFSPIFQAIELSATSLVSSKMTQARFSHLLTLLRWEGFQTPEGVLTLKKSLIHKIKEYGGMHVVYQSMKSMNQDGDQIKGIQFANGDIDEVLFNKLVLAGNPRSLTPWIEKPRAKEKWKKYISKLPVLAVKAYQVYYIHPDGIPVGMKPQGIILPRETEGEERRSLLRALRYALHFNEENNEYRLAVTVFLKLGGRIPSSEDLDSQIRRKLYELMPFLDDFMVRAPEEPIIPNMEEKKSDFREGFVYQLEQNAEPLFGISGLDPETPLRGTYLASEMILPGLGLDGETIAGLHIADLVAEAKPL